VQYETVSPLHGRRLRGGGGQVPPEFGAGDCLPPPDFVMLQNFKHQITCITMQENVFFASFYSTTFIVSPRTEFQSDLRLCSFVSD